MIDYHLLQHGFTNEVIAGYRRLLRSKHNDPDLYLGIAFWYGIRRIGTDLEILERYFHDRAIKSCNNARVRAELTQYILRISQ